MTICDWKRRICKSLFSPSPYLSCLLCCTNFRGCHNDGYKLEKRCYCGKWWTIWPGFSPNNGNSFLKGLTSLIVGGKIGVEFPGLLSISLSMKELPVNWTIGVKSGCPDESCGVENDLRDQPVLLGSGSLFLCQNVFGKFSRWKYLGIVIFIGSSKPWKTLMYIRFIQNCIANIFSVFRYMILIGKSMFSCQTKFVTRLKKKKTLMYFRFSSKVKKFRL